MRNQTFFIIFFKNKIKQNACLPLRKKNKKYVQNTKCYSLLINTVVIVYDEQILIHWGGGRAGGGEGKKKEEDVQETKGYA